MDDVELREMDPEETRTDGHRTKHARGGTDWTLDGQAGRLSAAEERFERGRRTLGLFLAPAVFLLLLVLPLGLTRPQQNLAAVLGLVVVLWITEAIPIPVAGILGVCLSVMLLGNKEVRVGGEIVPIKPDDIFASFSNNIIFLFIGSFILAQAMLIYGLDRRLAFNVLSMRFVGNSTTRIILAFGLIGALTSPFMSNTGAAAMMLPIAVSIMTSVGRLMAGRADGEHDRKRLRFGSALMLVITYSITVGGLLLPIGSPPNLIGRKAIQDDMVNRGIDDPITFVEWFLMALPIVVVMFIAVMAVVLLLNRPELKTVPGIEDYVAEEKRQLGPMSRGERNTLIAFGLAVVGWCLPGVIGLVVGYDSALYKTLEGTVLNEGVVAIIAAGLLFVLPVRWRERKFTLTWSQATRIDWGTILLFGSGIALGKLIEKTGLAEEIGYGLSEALNVSGLLTITVLVVIVAVLLSETTSNTASAAIVVPIAISLAAGANVDPIIPGLAAIFGANYGFMLPVSTPPNAIVYSSGYLPITRMIKAGAVFDVIGAVLCIVGVTVMAQLVGLA